ncbi:MULTISPECIES: DUF4163 domain-containing protein [Sphingomonas]|uniref:DUF4163 domain-containing protein n=1 Tax=Sphingomonas TaxID=13687 RepID=UPI000DEF3D42|nr:MULTISPECIES: DUF4163 domain-containing protein [Sphingomonas]
MLSLLLLAAAPVTVGSKDQFLAFHYAWSAEAAAISALDRRFRADSAHQRARYAAMARTDYAERQKSHFPWPAPYEFQRDWHTAGQTPRLLSLSSLTYVFSGGAHGNSATLPLLWDRRLGREVKIDTLLQRSGWWDGAIRQPYCILLDRARAVRRQAPVDKTDSFGFGACPQLKEVTLTLADENRNGRLDHVVVTADPYVAGPYAEGMYKVSLPLTAAMIARIKPDYRASFEPQPPVQ